MMNTIVKEKLLPFKELEQKIFNVESNEENDKRSRNARQLYKYLNNNIAGLLPY